MEPNYQIYQWFVIVISLALFVMAVWQGYTHSDYWYIFAIAGIYFFTTVMVYGVYLGEDFRKNIEPETMMSLSAILRIQSIITVGLLITITACCLRKRKWMIKR